MKCKAIWDEPRKCKNKCCFTCENLTKCQNKGYECKIHLVDNFKECSKLINN